jgi:hypothetical protein
MMEMRSVKLIRPLKDHLKTKIRWQCMIYIQWEDCSQHSM